MSRRMLLLFIATTLGAAPSVYLSFGAALSAASYRTVACCPAPVPEARMDLYRHLGTHWVRARRLYLGDRPLLVLLFRWRPKPYVDNRGWDTPSARLVVRRDQYPYTEFHPQVGQQGVLYVSQPMPRSRLPNTYNRFHIEVDIPRHASQWLGRLQFEFDVTNGTGDYGFYIDPGPTVLAAIPGQG